MATNGHGIGVIEAERQLAAARAEEAKQKREQAREEIKRLAAEGAKLKAELEPLVAQIKSAQAERLRLHGELVRARDAILRYSVPLDPLTFPSAADERERLRQLAAWKARQKELLALHEDAVRRESVRMHAIRLLNTLRQIQYQLENQASLAEGRRPGQVSGGVYIGVEDFIGSMPITSL